MKLIIFGTGLFYHNRKEKIPKDIQIVTFIDNNRSLWAKTLDGIAIDRPENINKYIFDEIVLMSKKDEEMREQLLTLNVDRKKIVTWSQFEKKFIHGRFHFFCGNEAHGNKENILIISTPFGYHGAPITAVYAAKALQIKGYNVVLCAEGGNKRFIDEIVQEGLNIVLCPALPLLGKEERFWIRQFDVVLVNTLLMIQCAYEISHFKPTVWWLHECSEKYENYYPATLENYEEYADKIPISKLNFIGVSAIAKENFNKYFPGCIREILSYGIPDDGYLDFRKNNENDKIIFAVIGTFNIRKGQREFLEAVRLLEGIEREKAEFWIIGAGGKNKYTDSIENMAKQCRTVKIIGELTRRDMKKIYGKIDVVVCPSLEETMSIVLTEGMMYGKDRKSVV